MFRFARLRGMPVWTVPANTPVGTAPIFKAEHEGEHYVYVFSNSLVDASNPYIVPNEVLNTYVPM